MNPALDTPEKVNALCQLSEEWCLIFRLVEEQDSLFSPFEQESNPQLKWMAQYKAFLKRTATFFTKNFSLKHQKLFQKTFSAAILKNNGQFNFRTTRTRNFWFS